MKGGIFMVRPEYDFKVIGRNLKRLRESKNLSVEDVRQYMQLGTIQAVYKWERGDGLPQADSLLALLTLYEVNDYRILFEESDSLSSLFLLKYCLRYVKYIVLLKFYSPDFLTYISLQVYCYEGIN